MPRLIMSIQDNNEDVQEEKKTNKKGRDINNHYRPTLAAFTWKIIGPQLADKFYKQSSS